MEAYDYMEGNSYLSDGEDMGRYGYQPEPGSPPILPSILEKCC